MIPEQLAVAREYAEGGIGAPPDVTLKLLDHIDELETAVLNRQSPLRPITAKISDVTNRVHC